MALQQRIWHPTWSEERDGICNEVWEDAVDNMEQTIGFSVKNAVLFPTEVEKGMWPEDYSLSDHARLTVVFSPGDLKLDPDGAVIKGSLHPCGEGFGTPYLSNSLQCGT
ncbi:hypothetical protein ACSBR1_015599 [Camellia fascicularis]